MRKPKAMKFTSMAEVPPSFGKLKQIFKLKLWRHKFCVSTGGVRVGHPQHGTILPRGAMTHGDANSCVSTGQRGDGASTMAGRFYRDMSKKRGAFQKPPSKCIKMTK